MIHEVALNAIGQMGNQADIYEVVMAQQFANERERDMKAIRAVLDPHPFANPSLEDDWAVMPVFVPTDAPSALVAEAGYAFDRYVMRGLWTWGRVVAMRRILGADSNGLAVHDRELVRLLQWPAVLADKVRDFAAADQTDATLTKWFSAYRLPECPTFRTRHKAAGKARILNEGEGGVEACAEPDDPGPKTPHYFVCPANAGEPQ
jgi:hypothetical protein